MRRYISGTVVMQDGVCRETDPFETLATVLQRYPQRWLEDTQVIAASHARELKEFTTSQWVRLMDRIEDRIVASSTRSPSIFCA